MSACIFPHGTLALNGPGKCPFLVCSFPPPAMQDLLAKRLIWLEIQDSMGFRRFTRGRLHGWRRKRKSKNPGKRTFWCRLFRHSVPSVRISISCWIVSFNGGQKCSHLLKDHGRITSGTAISPLRFFGGKGCSHLLKNHVRILGWGEVFRTSGGTLRVCTM